MDVAGPSIRSQSQQGVDGVLGSPLRRVVEGSSPLAIPPVEIGAVLAEHLESFGLAAPGCNVYRGQAFWVFCREVGPL
jgi:hypothetical protein